MWRLILILAVVLIGFQSPPAFADDDIDMRVSLPLGGIMKPGEWTRIEVSLMSESSDFSGKLQLHHNMNGYNSDGEAYQQEVKLEAKKSKQYCFEIPNEILMDGNIKVDLVKDDTVVATEKIMQNMRMNDYRGVVLDQNPNAFYFLSMRNEVDSPGTWRELNVTPLSAKKLPEESWLLRNLDLIAIGHVGANALNEKQIGAIKEWIQQGGTLLLSTGPNQAGILPAFQEFLSIAPGHSGTTSNLNLIRDLSGQNRLPVESIPVYNTDAPLFVLKQVGSGKILFINYDVNTEPLASWQFNRQMWQHLIEKYKLGITDSLPGIQDPMDRSVINLSRLIPGVSLPAVEWLVLIWILYVIVVSPVLYLVLKRKDRREWAWGIVPLFAILLTLGVYTIGRLQVSNEDASYSVSSVNILNGQLAKVSTAASFLASSGGTYQVQTEKGFLSVPLNFQNGLSRFAQADLTVGTDKDNLFTYSQVPYLTEKQAVATGFRTDIGSFANNLYVEENQLAGSITNKTSYDMDEIYVDLGMQRIALGALKKGETKQVKEKLKELYLPDLSQNRGERLDISVEQQKEKMKNSVINPTVMNQIRIVGVSSQPLKVLTMLTEKNTPYYLNVLTQPLRLSPATDGRIHYPFGTLSVESTREDGMVERTGPYTWEMGKGSVTFRLDVNSLDLNVKKIEIPLDQSPYRPFVKEIYHVKSGTWKKLNRDERVILEKNLSEYITRDGNIEIRISNPADQRLSLPEPNFNVEGEEK